MKDTILFIIAGILIIAAAIGLPWWFGHVINATGRGFGVGG